MKRNERPLTVGRTIANKARFLMDRLRERPPSAVTLLAMESCAWKLARTVVVIIGLVGWVKHGRAGGCWRPKTHSASRNRAVVTTEAQLRGVSTEVRHSDRPADSIVQFTVIAELALPCREGAQVLRQFVTGSSCTIETETLSHKAFAWDGPGRDCFRHETAMIAGLSWSAFLTFFIPRHR